MHIWIFFWAVLDNWAGFFTGGIIIAVVAFWLTWKGKAMTRKFLIGLSICFFVMATYKAWEEQYEKADAAVKIVTFPEKFQKKNKNCSISLLLLLTKW